MYTGWKMCKSMSTKRCLLILFALSVVVLSAKVTSWIYCSSYHLTTSASKSLTGYDLNKIVTAPLGNYNLEYENRLVYTDNVQSDRFDRMTIKPLISLSRKWENYFGKVYYRGEYFDKTADRDFLTAANMPALHHTYNQQAGFTSNYKFGGLTGILNARHRTFYYDPIKIIGTDILDGEHKIRQVNNLSSNAEIGYSIIKPVTVFAVASIKAASDKKTDIYNTKTAGVGLKLNLPITYSHYLQGMTRIDWQKGDQLSIDEITLPDWTKIVFQSTERLMPITNSLRLTQMVTPQIMGFVSYENRSFYDTDHQEFLFNSHYLRGSGKYTIPFDATNASFIEIGAKYAPDKETKYNSSNYFAKSEVNVIDKLYLGAGFNSMPRRITKYEGIARYYITPWNEVFVNAIHSEDPEFNKTNNFISAGVRLMF